MFVARVTTEVENDEVGYVAAKAKACCDKHEFAVYFSGVVKSFDSFDKEPNQ